MMSKDDPSKIESPLEQRHVQWTLLAVGTGCLVVMLGTGAAKWFSAVSVLAPEAKVSTADSDPMVGVIQIDINRAPAHELALLPGVGPVLAERIVDDRTRNGDFISVDDLRRVYGIGPKKLDEFSRLCVVDVEQVTKVPNPRR